MGCFPLFFRMMLLCVLALFLLESHYNTIANLYQLIKPKTSLQVHGVVVKTLAC